MSKIDELIEELCPEGVPRQPLLEVCQEILVPMRDRPKDLSGEIPWCRIEDIDRRRLAGSKMGLGVSLKVVKEMNLKVFPAGTVVASCSASLGTYAIAEQPVITNQTFIGLVCGSKIENKYLLYLLTTMTGAIKKLASTGTIPYVSREKFERLLVPVPPLEVQREIVSSLDKFTQLEAELEAELEARRIQYQVTRDRLLDFDGDLSSHPLGEMIGEVCPTGVSMKIISEVIGKVGSIKWGEAGGQEYRYLDLSSVDLLTHEIGETTKISSANAPSRARQIVQKGDVIFATTRPAQMRFARIPETYDGQIASTGYCVLRPEPTDVLSGFLEHSLGSRAFRAYVVNNQVEGNYPSISDRAIKDFAFHVPPLEIQQEIVSILDKLDALVNDITIGLPAEIAARRKQYEYYRNKLLTFKELEAA